MKLAYAVLIGTLALAGCQKAPPAPEPASKDTAMTCLRDNDLPCAEANLRGYLKQYPTDSESTAVLAITLTKAGKHRESLPFYDTAVKAGQVTYDLFAFYARSLDATGNLDHAIVRTVGEAAHHRRVVVGRVGACGWNAAGCRHDDVHRADSRVVGADELPEQIGHVGVHVDGVDDAIREREGGSLTTDRRTKQPLPLARRRLIRRDHRERTIIVGCGEVDDLIAVAFERSDARRERAGTEVVGDDLGHRQRTVGCQPGLGDQ